MTRKPTTHAHGALTPAGKEALTQPDPAKRPVAPPRPATKSFSNIALIFNMSIFGYGVCQGAARFALERGGWLLLPYKAEPNLDAMREWLRFNRIDGIICCLPFQDAPRFLEESDIPYVNVLLQGMRPGVTSVTTDSEAVARMAVDFLVDAGFSAFAFFGYSGLTFSDQREAAFRDILAARGHSVHFFPQERHHLPDDFSQEQLLGLDAEGRLGKWLHGLPKPVAIWACNDACGQQVIRVAQRHGIAVPEEVTVLGVDNDETLCNLCSPTLSSIDQNREGIGYAAARTLDGLMGRSVVPGTEIRIPPKCVVERQSTNLIPVKDPLVAEALRIIRDRVRENFTSQALSAELHCAPAKLNSLFKAHLGRTVSDVMTRFRVKRITKALQETDLPLKEVAAMFGFSSPAVLSMFIQRQTGTTPLKLRQQNRPGASFYCG